MATAIHLGHRILTSAKKAYCPYCARAVQGEIMLLESGGDECDYWRHMYSHATFPIQGSVREERVQCWCGWEITTEHEQALIGYAHKRYKVDIRDWAVVAMVMVYMHWARLTPQEAREHQTIHALGGHGIYYPGPQEVV